ncbi:MAG: endolytic transglycosylase MltG [Patescibacteria group bacterium]|nr:endolytic transglycosylase MltG [Patescibacteria group bacterium]MDD5121690.1 endolytic transglycosylase MltG [Patescibacteria group bacterium]MDD5396146.1 endolytic transglycosylase MltG [Patescibacteria group bacterium]
MPVKAIIIGYLIFAVLAVFLYFNWQAMAPKAKNLEPQAFVLENGQGVKEIAAQLKNAGLIKNDTLFKTLVFLMNAKNSFWPGKYYLSPDMDVIKVIKTLTARQGPDEVSATIIEGWSNKEIAAYLEKLNLVSQKDFLAALANDQDKFRTRYSWLDDVPKSINLEGFLFPDTYRFYKETTADDIIDKMLANFDQKITPDIITAINKNHRTLFQTITMASLVEKEASDDVERRLIADVFWRRLENKIALQSCASVNYVLGETKKRLSIADTQTKSPYNTYLNRGLPPGPIDNPGLSSIKAAVYPLSNDYWFFLAADNGKTIFSKTLEEHNQNKKVYLK